MISPAGPRLTGAAPANVESLLPADGRRVADQQIQVSIPVDISKLGIGARGRDLREIDVRLVLEHPTTVVAGGAMSFSIPLHFNEF
jgi:hypothetical protein